MRFPVADGHAARGARQIERLLDRAYSAKSSAKWEGHSIPDELLEPRLLGFWLAEQLRQLGKNGGNALGLVKQSVTGQSPRMTSLVG